MFFFTAYLTFMNINYKNLYYDRILNFFINNKIDYYLLKPLVLINI